MSDLVRHHKLETEQRPRLCGQSRQLAKAAHHVEEESDLKAIEVGPAGTVRWEMLLVFYLTLLEASNCHIPTSNCCATSNQRSPFMFASCSAFQLRFVERVTAKRLGTCLRHSNSVTCAGGLPGRLATDLGCTGVKD